ncbi:unnamed protein product [Coffea canephora]|uniref:Uncharacterized protein n=2 Tax=Coffea TaxID=13442 RepID=A0A068U2U8_COFCA|nr:uncharacterized protein LOC113698818 [Coffea arabica]XP_027078447.1 uncharacterized protein LOC113701823 [Coffea arabica]XP_027154576.1 uncharacterized protein LOC113754374 [Coffea eugenioides]CDP02489.1 unnamed protein product [Coffea canephora]
MACLDMYNQNSNDQHSKLPLGVGAPNTPPTTIISPRISFSNDFIESSSSSITSHSTSHRPHMVRTYRDAPVSSDFEFSVSNYSMMSADELFSQGRLLPLKENCGTRQFQKTTTLRDELQQVEEEDDEDDIFSLRPPKSSSTRWKGFLGLKKSHIGSKKIDKAEGSRSAFAQDEAHSGNGE